MTTYLLAYESNGKCQSYSVGLQYILDLSVNSRVEVVTRQQQYKNARKLIIFLYILHPDSSYMYNVCICTNVSYFFIIISLLSTVKMYQRYTMCHMIHGSNCIQICIHIIYGDTYIHMFV